jgi:ubiquinone/menaquinone biosynthesis C-methylase UbiE
MRTSAALRPEHARWYARHYYAIEDEVLPIFERLDAMVLDSLVRPRMRVLDAMMGRGRGALRYAARGARVTGNDLNLHMVDLVREQAAREGVRVALWNKDVRALGGRGGEFDVVFAMYSSLGTIPGDEDRDEAVRELARVARPGGLVVVHAHNRLDTLFERHFWRGLRHTVFFPANGLRRGDIVHDYGGLRGMYNHLYSPGELRRQMRNAGLRVLAEHYMDYKAVRFIGGPLRALRADGFIFVGRKFMNDEGLAAP